MSDGDSIAQVAVVILLLSLAVPALATAHEYSGTPIEYTESATVDYNNTTQLSEPATVEGYSENITVTTSNGKVLTEGSDYQWNESAGEITWLDNSNTNDGESVTVDYAAYQRTEESAMAWTILSPLMGLFGLFGFAVSVRALWDYTAEVWDL